MQHAIWPVEVVQVQLCCSVKPFKCVLLRLDELPFKLLHPDYTCFYVIVPLPRRVQQSPVTTSPVMTALPVEIHLTVDPVCLVMSCFFFSASLVVDVILHQFCQMLLVEFIGQKARWTCVV